MMNYGELRTQEFSRTSQLELGLLDEKGIIEKPKVRRMGKGKTGISFKKIGMSYEEANNIVKNYQEAGPYLVGLAVMYVDSRQLPKIDNPRNLSPEQYSRYRYLGHIVLGVAKRILKSKN